MRNDFEEEREEDEEADLAFLKGKSAVAEAGEEDEAVEDAGDDDVFESVDNPFSDSEDSESGYALYSSEEDDLSLQF